MTIRDAIDKGFKVYEFRWVGDKKINKDKLYYFREFSYRNYIRYIFAMDRDKNIAYSTYLGDIEDLIYDFSAVSYAQVANRLYEMSMIVTQGKINEIVRNKIAADPEILSSVYMAQSVINSRIMESEYIVEPTFSELMDLPLSDILIFRSLSTFCANEKEKKQAINRALNSGKDLSNRSGRRGSMEMEEEETYTFSSN